VEDVNFSSTKRTKNLRYNRKQFSRVFSYRHLSYILYSHEREGDRAEETVFERDLVRLLAELLTAAQLEFVRTDF